MSIKPTKIDDKKRPLFTMLNVELDIEGKSPKQVQAIIKRILKDRETIAHIEKYLTGKLKPFGIDTVSHLRLEKEYIYDA